MRKVKLFGKWLSLMLGVAMMFTACGQEVPAESSSSSSEKEEVASSSSEVVESTEEVEELDPYTVTWWLPGDKTADFDMVMDAVNERLAELLPNTELEIVMVAGSEMNDRWSKAMAVGEKVDLVWSANWTGVNPYTAVDQETVLPMTSLLEKYGQEMVEGIGGEKILNMHTFPDGEIYFFPSYQGLAQGRSGVFLRQEIVDLMPAGWLEDAQKRAFEHTGYTAEDLNVRFDILEEYMEVAEQNNMLGNGLNTNNFETYMKIGGEGGTGYFTVVKEGNVYTAQNGLIDDVAKAFYARVKEWYDKGWIRKDIASAEIKEDDSYCLQVKGAVESDWLEMENVRRDGQGFTWETTGFLLNPNTRITHGFNTGNMICYTTENAERAIMVLNLVNTDAELYNLIVFGIEGTHYTVNADGTIKRPTQEERTYAGVSNWRVGNCVNSLIEEGNDINTYKKKLEQDKTGEVRTLAGLVLKTGDFSTEAANLQAVVAEYGDWITSLSGKGIDFAVLESKLKEAGWDVYQAGIIAQMEKYIADYNLGTLVVK